jgi:hypothetical protein
VLPPSGLTFVPDSDAVVCRFIKLKLNMNCLPPPVRPSVCL